MSRHEKRPSQEGRILWLLHSCWPSWVPAPALSKISLQYSARIFSLRRKGWLIENRLTTVNGVKHGEFRLGDTSFAGAVKTDQAPLAETPAPETKKEIPAGDLLFPDPLPAKWVDPEETES